MRKGLKKVSACFFENTYSTYSKYRSESCFGISVPAFLLSHWFIFSSVQCTCHGLLTVQLLGSQAAFGTTFRITGGYQKAVTSFLKRVTGSIFTSKK
jgi:hypothetical protein